MYYTCGCNNFCPNQNYQTPCYANYGCQNQGNSSYAIVLVLFILLVIVLGTRFSN